MLTSASVMRYIHVRTCIYNNYVQIMIMHDCFPISKRLTFVPINVHITSLTQSSHQVLNPVALYKNSCCGHYSSLHGISKVPNARAILPSRPHPCPVFL